MQPKSDSAISSATSKTKTLKPEDMIVIIDRREQLPYDLHPFKMIPGTLKSGDYSIRGFEDKVSVERKTLADWISSISQGRDRFEREIERLLSFESKMILVEGSANDIWFHKYRSKMNPKSVMGTIASFAAKGIPVMLAGDREIAQDMCKRFLFLCAKYRQPQTCDAS